MEVGLVSCTKRKRNEPSRPAELYSPSPLFRKASTYARQHHDEWYVLSAKHRLLDPDGPAIEPYDESLTDVGVQERRLWARQVLEELEDRRLLETDVTLVVHAGKAYYEELLPLLGEYPVKTRIPTEGLALGETLSWYNERLPE